MYFHTLVTDYDGTLAHDGRVEPGVVDALKRFKETGRRIVLVTGRQLPDVKQAFAEFALFDRIVAENGAVLYNPANEDERSLAPPPDAMLIARLTELGITPLSVGRTIVATWEPHETTVLDVIRDLGLELQIVFNKGAVMVLPPNVNKASGVLAALADLEMSAHNAVGVGDAENDHAFLKACGCAAAVANALPVIKESADIVLAGARGAGAIELMARMVDEDARLLPSHRHGLRLGADDNGEVWLEPQQGLVLIAGLSGTGKSTVATAVIERMAEGSFQFCVFDPEGDYHDLDQAVPVGDAQTPPKPPEVLQLLRRVGANIVVSLQAVPLAERPVFFRKLLGEVLELRARLGRPHWLVIDEAHHFFPEARDGASGIPAGGLGDAIFVTVHPEAVSADVLRSVGTVVALGVSAVDTLRAFAGAIDETVPTPAAPPADEDEVLVWRHTSGEPPRVITAERPHQKRQRHTRKYAEGELGEDRSFYFRGPNGALNLRAQNLMLFLQIADGVDDPTWEHHLRKGDYSAWFRNVIKDRDLADDAAAIESDRALIPRESRRRLAEVVRLRYTAPAATTRA